MEKELEELNKFLKGKEVRTPNYKGRVYKLENVGEKIKIDIIGNGQLHQIDFLKGFTTGQFSFKNEAVNTQLREMKLIKRYKG